MNEDVDYDPWDDAPDEIDPAEIREMLYESGIKSFPLDVLEKMWLRELRDVGLSKVDASTGVPPKAESHQVDRMSTPLQGDVRQVTLGKSRKGAWIAFDGPRTERGYMDIVVLAEPLRTETAIVAALTTLEASPVNDIDFEQLQEALVQHVQAHPELESVKLQELLSQLPTGWFRHQMPQIDEGRRQRDDVAWQRSLTYQVALLRHRRPDFDDLDLEEQLMLVDKFRRLVNRSLEANRNVAAFLEYGTPQKGLPTRVKEQARAQVQAAVLADVADLRHRDIAVELGVDIPERYEINMKIPAVQRMVERGREILDRALGRRVVQQGPGDEIGRQALPFARRRYRQNDRGLGPVARLEPRSGPGQARGPYGLREHYQVPSYCGALATPPLSRPLSLIANLFRGSYRENGPHPKATPADIECQTDITGHSPRTF
jgi:hypothetical protein